MEDINPDHKNSNKDALVEQAFRLLESNYSEYSFDAEDYEITAWTNTEKTIVKFRRIIRFTPLDKKDENLDYDFEVNLTHQTISPFDTWGMKRFYKPTKIEQEKIDFVVDAFGMPRLGFNNSIVEDSTMYKIHIDNEVAFGHYFLDKITGEECMGSIEGSYAPMPDDIPELVDPDPLIEIVD